MRDVLDLNILLLYQFECGTRILTEMVASLHGLHVCDGHISMRTYTYTYPYIYT